MKKASAKKQGLLGLALASAALLAIGCIGTIHGGGVVSLYDVETGLGAGVLTDANVAVSVICNDRKDAVLSTIHWTDNANGVNFTAHLPWTPLAEIPEMANVETCEEAAAIVSEVGVSVSLGVINTQGQQSGAAVIGVTTPGAILTNCGDLQGVYIQADGAGLPGGHYHASGCLDRGKITFQTP